MDELLTQETRNLQSSWMRHKRELLRDYLVQDVEDPRLNVSSILIRHWLVNALLPGRFEALMEQELQFAVAMNWILRMAANCPPGWADEAICGLMSGQEESSTPTIPPYIFRTFEGLSHGNGRGDADNYLADALLSMQANPRESGAIPERILNTFGRLWQNRMGSVLHPLRRLTVMEQACGSANDYRCLESYGVARLLEYTGQDLCTKNIRNAREMFPCAKFEAGNVLDIHTPDKCVDLCFAQDLLEHLSPQAMERAMDELCRVTRRQLLVGFFNMHNRPEHCIRPMDPYHWNDLSMEQTMASFEKRGGKVSAVEIDALLASRFGCGDTHNKGAWTFIVSFD